MTRSVPVIASVVLHGAIAVGLVATAGGHTRAGAGTPLASLDIDVDTTTEAPLLAPVELPVQAPPQIAKDEPLPAHTHPYPVAPSHEAHAHDPSLEHPREDSRTHHDEDHDPPAADKGEPSPAAPALVASGPALPHFTMSSGSGAVAGARVVSAAGDGAGNGAGVAATAGGDDVTHGVSSVQVAARLVQSVTAAYPVHARADEVEGDVAVEIVVDREGRVVDARVTRPAGHGFDAAALAAVRAYRFSPAQREGRAVRVRMPWSVQFRLR